MSRDGIIFSYKLNAAKSPVSPSKFHLHLKEYKNGILKVTEFRTFRPRTSAKPRQTIAEFVVGIFSNPYAILSVINHHH